MWKYIFRRFISLIPVIIGVTFIVFLIMNMAPGDPVKSILGEQASPEAIEELREELGLNDNVLIQYKNYFLGLLRGDMGTSYKTKVGVAEEIGARLPTTAKLAVIAILIAIILSIPLGILAAVKQNTWLDSLTMFIALLGVSIPVFWLGLMLLLFFSLKLGWFPVSGASTWQSFILPGVTLGFLSMAAIARVTRSSMLEVIRQDYIRTARSKGVPYKRIITKHALRNALIPTITVAGLQIGTLLGGSVLTETVFGLPGIGRLMIQSIQGRDIPMVLGCIIVFTVAFSIVNLIVDIIYAFVDPRIKNQYS
ncbi:nickel ABC transporter permease [Fusibacter ferrireducens]|uniref:Nickel import system permease protein NikB n=1 Tax=Fusibacter ferrireducens TaxID=2785058 RepID=A0ABR9ZYL5_9FIRM|nr:nickel ABC transporter permease [Fusibacter ferrireducens]MBF4695544.1 ABC transporter permease [Fusibacter ferrireducens]